MFDLTALEWILLQNGLEFCLDIDIDTFKFCNKDANNISIEPHTGIEGGNECFN